VKHAHDGQALGDLHIHETQTQNHDFQPGSDHICADAKHWLAKRFLICWHHGKLPDLTRAVLDKAKNVTRPRHLPKHWKR